LFLQGAAAAVTAMPHSGLAAPADAPPAARFAIARKVLRDSDNLFGPRQVIPSATRQVSVIRQAARQARGGDQRDLRQVQVQFADLIGWLYQDSRDFQAAQYWLDRALEWSHLAGDPGSVAFILARKSQLSADMGDASAAIATAEAAIRLGRPGTRILAAAAAYAAHGHALAGDGEECDRLYSQAETLLASSSDDGSQWAAEFCDPPYIGVQRAHSLAALGRHAEAAAGFRAAIAGLRPSYHRDHGVYLAREAVAFGWAGALDQAAALGLEALGIGTETLSARIFSELATLDDIFAGNSAADGAGFRDAFASTVLRPV